VGDVGVAAAIRHPSHTMAAAASRSRLAAIRLVLAAAHGPRHPDAHTIGPACERQPLGRDRAGASICHPAGTACERQPLGRDPAGAARRPHPQASGRPHDRHRL